MPSNGQVVLRPLKFGQRWCVEATIANKIFYSQDNFATREELQSFYEEVLKIYE